MTKSMQPLRIELTLISPIVCPQRPIHLDADLAALRVEEEGDLRGDAMADWSSQHDLPFERHDTDDGSWFFKASIFDFAPIDGRQNVRMIRAPGRTEAAIDQGRIFNSKGDVWHVGKGPTKGYLMAQPVQWCPTAYAYCIGDGARVSELLSRATSIGPMRRNGWGRVSGFTVAVDPDAHDQWRRRNLPMNSPDALQTGHAPGVSALHAPYWERSDHRAVLIPI